MTSVYETEDGQQFENDNLKRKEKCDFCGKLGEVSSEDDFIDGKLPQLSNENHDRADICRDCITEGLEKEQLEKHLKTKEEIIEEKQEREVELS